MLRVTVEFVGPTSGRRKVLAEATIGRVGQTSEFCHEYQVELKETVGARVEQLGGRVKAYPRWATSIWDLVARALCVALSGAETLPPRPSPVMPRIPIHKAPGGLQYVFISELPEPLRSGFEAWAKDKGRPEVAGGGLAAFRGDVEDFVAGG